jgi:DNA-directed RNA polymerase subunit RPC12/RpoP
MSTTTAAIVLLISIVFTGTAGWFFWSQTKKKTRWGINFAAKCARCGTQMPLIRKPDSVQQTMWGGWTCPNCGAHLDKYGREVTT